MRNGHNAEHGGLQNHSIGSVYPWTISAKHGSTGIRYYGWNTISGEQGPCFSVDDCQSTSAHKLAELWIQARIADEQARSTERNAIQPISTWDNPSAERSIAWNVPPVERNVPPVERLHEYTFLIPVKRDSDRKDHEIEAYTWLAERLFAEFGGYSLAGNVVGTWEDSHGERIDDISTVYRVAIKRERFPVLRAIVDDCKARFDQQTVYLVRTSTFATIS